MPRQDTRLESEGAEFLVLGRFLIHKIAAYKTYTNMPGYDLVATNPENNTSAKIQVKSRWATNSGGFPIKNFNCDFVVVVLLNRGSKDSKPKDRHRLRSHAQISSEKLKTSKAYAAIRS